MIHTAERLIEEGWSVAIVDLTSIGANITAEQWYRGILVSVADQTGIDLDAAAWWDNNGQLGPTDRFSRFFGQVLLQELPQRRMAVFFDEIDSILALPFRGAATDDFFAALRALYLGRAHDRELTRLSIVMLGVAEPSDLIKDPERTPFNIGRRIELCDFSEEEAAALLPNSGVPAESALAVLREVLAWTGGHPYLTLRVFRSFQERPLAKWSETDVDQRMAELFQGPASEDDSNLRFARDMLLVRSPDKAAVLEKYIAVVQGKKVRDEPSLRELGWLKLSGLIREQSGWLESRNRVYREILRPSGRGSSFRRHIGASCYDGGRFVLRHGFWRWWFFFLFLRCGFGSQRSKRERRRHKSIRRRHSSASGLRRKEPPISTKRQVMPESNWQNSLMRRNERKR